MSKENTVDAAELKRQLEYARSLKDEDIDKSDPDARVLSDEQWDRARPFHEVLRERQNQRSVTLRVDADVLDFFQRKGEGYQTRMSEALRAQMNAEQQQEAKC